MTQQPRFGKPFALPHHRLEAQQQIHTRSTQPFFTSDLSTNEYFLTREAGCNPLGVVMGSSFYQAGFYRNFWGYRTKTGEVAALTQAQLAVRALAVSRLQQEAALLGAHGVIGVRLERRREGLFGGTIEFTAIGTAISIPGLPPTQTPFTSDLSGQEFWQLRQAGYLPKSLVFGVCSYYVHSDRTTRNLMNRSFWNVLFGRGRRNQEMVQFTQGLQDARELAVLRLTQDLQQLGATGSVGMQIEMSEEAIVYQPRSLFGCLLQSILVVGISSLFLSAMLHQSAWMVTIFTFLFAHPGLPVAIFAIILGRSLWNSLTNAGPFRDLLTHFVAIGTAIVEAEAPVTDPVSNTLMLYPLSKA
jgi:uncharacterized protein YbjQ (UPF0145 family)